MKKRIFALTAALLLACGSCAAESAVRLTEIGFYLDTVINLTAYVTDGQILKDAMAECGITAEIFPLWDTMLATGQSSPFHQYSVGVHTVKVIENVPPDEVLRLAAFLHDCGKPACRTTDAGGRDHFFGHADAGARLAEDFLREYRFDNRTIADVNIF